MEWQAQLQYSLDQTFFQQQVVEEEVPMGIMQTMEPQEEAKVHAWVVLL